MKWFLSVGSRTVAGCDRRSAPLAMLSSARAMQGHIRRSAGFTLIELMIVVAIVAILAAIAYPSYTHQVIKTRRTAAKACLSEYSNYMERYYTTNLSYAGAADPGLDCESAAQTGKNYAYAFVGTPDTSTYTVSATPRGPQVVDTECGMLSLNQTGKRDAEGDPATCW